MEMAANSIAHDPIQNHDALRYGLPGVKGDIVGSHPLQSLRQSMRTELEEKKRAVCDLTYGSAFNLRKDLDCQILSRFQRPPGALPSSMLGLEALTGDLEDFGFEDYLNSILIIALFACIHLCPQRLLRMNLTHSKTHISNNAPGLGSISPCRYAPWLGGSSWYFKGASLPKFLVNQNVCARFEKLYSDS